MIVEASAQGREVECSVLGNEEPETSLPGEIVAHADWYDFEAKYSEGGMELRGAGADRRRRPARVRELAARVFALTGCSGLARCDFFVEPDGEVLVNEINTMPGLHRDQRLREALRGRRHRLPGALRPPASSSRSSATSAPLATSSSRPAVSSIRLDVVISSR